MQEIEELKAQIEGLRGLVVTSAAATVCLNALGMSLPVEARVAARQEVEAALRKSPAIAAAPNFEIEVRRMADLCFPLS